MVGTGGGAGGPGIGVKVSAPRPPLVADGRNRVSKILCARRRSRGRNRSILTPMLVRAGPPGPAFRTKNQALALAPVTGAVVQPLIPTNRTNPRPPPVTPT